MRRIMSRASVPLTENSTDANRETGEEAALRRAGVNAMVTGLMSLLSADGERYDRMIVVVVEAWLPWR